MTRHNQKPRHLPLVLVSLLAMGFALTAAMGADAAKGDASPEKNYNDAIAMYRKGNYAQARTLLRASLATHRADLEAKTQFNLGNCSYAQALKILTPPAPAPQAKGQPTPQKKPDRQAAIRQLDQAIACYRQALRAQANDTDARVNIELAQKLKRQLQKQEKEEKKKQQQQKKDQKKNQKNDQKNQNQKKQDQKDQQAGKDSEKKPQDQKDQQAGKDSEKKPQDQKDQQAGKDSEKKPQDQKDQQAGKDSEKKPQDQKDQQAGKDSEKKPQDQKDQQAGKDSEKKPQDQKDQQAGKDSEKKPPSGAEEKKPAVAEASQAEKVDKDSLSDEQTARLLQAIRDRHLRRRLTKQQRQRARQTPVDKDW